MRLQLTLLFCLIYFCQGSAQESLSAIIQSPEPDSIKVQKLLRAANKYEGSNTDSEKVYVDTARYLALKANYLVGRIRTNNFLSSINEEEGKYAVALNFALTALKMAEKAGLKEQEAKSANNVAIVYYDLKDYDTALNYYSLEYKTDSEIHDTASVITVLNNMGAVYTDEKNYAKGMKFYQLGLSFANLKRDSNSLSAFYSNIGGIFTRQENYKEALDYEKRAFEIAKARRNYTILGSISNIIGSIYDKEKDYDNALKYSYKADSIATLQKDENLMLKAYTNLIGIYRRRNQNDSAFHYLWYYDSLHQLIYSNESTKQIADMQTKYNTKKKEETILLLSAEHKHQQTVIYFILAFTALLLSFIWFIYRSYRKKSMINRELDIKNRNLSDANTIIAEKNKDITDSIRYALLIQNARLPVKTEILKHLPNSFILYKPKDIISGDFYFFQQNDKVLYLAAADCTGHGVPGAMMSMIGSEKLEYAITKFRDPSKILCLLNSEVRYALKQTDSSQSSHDGMDIALCRIDAERRTVSYAGANRPLWIVTAADKNTIKEIKPNKLSIGGYTQSEQLFTEHELSLSAGDSLYIFSDGFADTFNGKTGKKLTVKRFRELILKIQNIPFGKQENYLNDFIEDWKAGTDQTDDILIVGVQF